MPVKKSTGTVRITVDYRNLNQNLVIDMFQLPRIDEILNDRSGNKSGNKKFSVLDLKAGYHQLDLDPEVQHLTTFTTAFGVFRYKKLSAGEASTPSIFARTMARITSGRLFR